MRLSTIIIMVLVFGLCVTGLSTFYLDSASSYSAITGVAVSNSTWSEGYSRQSEAYSMSSDVWDNTFNTENEDTDSLFSIVCGAYSSIRMVRDSLTWVKEMATQFKEEYNIPDAVWWTFITIFILVVTFTIITAVFKTSM